MEPQAHQIPPVPSDPSPSDPPNPPPPFTLQVDLSEDRSLKSGDDSAAAAAAALLHVDLSESKASRLPRWSRHETLVLIEAKKEGEARVKKPRERDEQNRPVSESKWLFISAVCKKRGVDREPNQCRKRWGNLFGDYKRIKEWQSDTPRDESFWSLRSDERKEYKLPGSFDPEVFDAMEGFLGRKAATAAAPPTDVPTTAALIVAPLSAVPAAREGEGVLENGRLTSEEGLVSDIEHPAQEEDATPDAARGGAGSSTPDPDSYKQQSTCKEELYKEQSPTHSNGRKKRKYPPYAVESDQPKDQLLAVLENNCKVLSEHIEAQNRNSQLDRAQRKEQVDSLVRVLGKLASALEKISEKLQKHEVGGCL